MTKNVNRLTAVGCAVLVLAGVLFLTWCWRKCRLAEAREHAEMAARAKADAEARAKADAEAKAAAEREAVYRQFSIYEPGTRLFVPLPPMLSHNHGRAEIGRKLFNDRRLTGLPSTPTLVCGRCHHLGGGGTDSKIHHGVLTRPVYNASFATVYFHDGSASNLQAAVTKMIEDPCFSGGRRLETVVARLAEDKPLVERFSRSYKDGLSGSNVVDAIVEYMKTLVTNNKPFDYWSAGQADRFTPEQQRGSEVFLAARCMDCHDGPVLGSRKVSGGRKVPALRGLGLRKAYLTEGKVKDLDAVVPLMPGGGALPPEDRKALVEFLKTL